MPHKPKRPCRYPGCPNLCETGTYCEVHRKEWSPESLRGNAAARGYDAKWRDTNFSLKINHPAVAFPPWLRCRPLTFTHRRCSALRKRRQRRANPLDSSAGWSRLPKAVARLLCASKPADLRLAMTKNPLAVCLTFRLKLVSKYSSHFARIRSALASTIRISFLN